MISTKIEAGNASRIWFATALSVLLFCSVSSGAEESRWKEYSLRELIGRLKYYTFAKVAQSLRGTYPVNQEQIWENADCIAPVSELPGPFFCGLLRYQAGTDSVSANSFSAAPPEVSASAQNTTSVAQSQNPASPAPGSPPNVSGGNGPTVSRSLTANSIPKEYKNIQLYSGTTIAGKNVVRVVLEEDTLRAFYLTNGQISHYEFRDKVVIFDWSGSKLNSILEVRVDPILRPLSGREFHFR
ncbi:LIC_11883 family protein [Leptospira ellisii]|uniref:LIC_11883 family protein n=1 Tax=Leptospira ellisii TaxID=2023197 RepID=UPI003C6D3E85